MSFLLNLLFPHRDNNHKAGLIKSHAILILSLSFVFFQVFLNFFALSRPSVLGFSSSITPEKIIELTNIERSNSNLGMLRENRLLSEAARQKAADMFAFNYWAHVSPSGRTPWAFFNDAGYKYQYAGENLARDFSDPQAVVTAWMNSPSHRENIVNSKYQEIGVAVVNGTLQGVETTLVVQLFGTPYGSVTQKPATPQTAQEPLTVPVEQSQEQPAQEVVQAPQTNGVLAKGQEVTIPASNPLDVTKAMAFIILGILIGVFAADVLLVSHKHTPRLSSRSLAQMVFLIAVLVASFLVKQGAIL